MPTYHLTIDLDHPDFWDADTFRGDILAMMIRCCAQHAQAAGDVMPGESREMCDNDGNVVGREWITE